MIDELISRVFASRNATHIEHWRTKSYAAHIALGEFYDGVIDNIDGIVEAYQGAFDLVKVGTLAITRGLPSLDNMLQTLEDLYLSTLYKLKHLS